MHSTGIKVIAFAAIGSETLSFLEGVQAWLEQHHIYADGVLIDMRSSEPTVVKGQKGKSTEQATEEGWIKAVHQSAQTTSVLKGFSASSIRSLTTIPLEAFPTALYQYSTHADLILISMEMFGTEVFKKFIADNACAPAYVMARNPITPAYAILPADMKVLKKVLPLKKYLINDTELVILSFNQRREEEKMLMSYVQRHCQQPGYMYLEKVSEAQLLNLLRQSTLVGISQTCQNPIMKKLSELATQKAQELGLSFLLV